MECDNHRNVSRTDQSKQGKNKRTQQEGGVKSHTLKTTELGGRKLIKYPNEKPKMKREQNVSGIKQYEQTTKGKILR